MAKKKTNGKKRSRKKKQKYGDELLKFLTKEEYVEDGKQKHPKINGLLRLAKDHKGGIKATNLAVNQSPNSNNGMVAVVTKTVVFGDDTMHSAVADAHPGNMAKVISGFATATADTRALSRAIRLALGISVTAAEEYDPKDGDVKEQEIKDKSPSDKMASDAQRQYIDIIKNASKISDKELKKILSKFSYKPTSAADIKTEADATTVIGELKKLAASKNKIEEKVHS